MLYVDKYVMAQSVQFTVNSVTSLIRLCATFSNQEIGGHCSDIGQSYHNNTLELVACLYASESFSKTSMLY